jgi:hypothetical protein
MISLPYGWRNTKLHGIKVEIPNTLRLQRNNMIIKMYEQYLEEKNAKHLLLSKSSMIRILKTCTAERRKSIQGIDSHIANGSDVSTIAFQKAFRPKITLL